MQREALERLLGRRTSGEELAFIQVAAVPGVGVAAVQEDNRAGRSLGPFGRAVAFDALERGRTDGQHAALEFGHVFEAHDVSVALGFDFRLGGAVPTGARQAALEGDEAEVTVAERDDVRALAFGGVFALQREIRPRGFDGQEDRRLGVLGRRGFRVGRLRGVGRVAGQGDEAEGAKQGREAHGVKE